MIVETRANLTNIKTRSEFELMLIINWGVFLKRKKRFNFQDWKLISLLGEVSLSLWLSVEELNNAVFMK